MADRTLHLLAVVRDGDLARRVEPMLRGVGATYLITEEIAPEHVTFAHRLGDAVMLVGVKDPLALLAYLRLAGVDLPVVVFHTSRDGQRGRQLLAGGAARLAPLPRSTRELMSVVGAALDDVAETDPAPHDITLDPVGLTVRWRDGAAKLTRREFAVLHGLVSRAGTPVSIARLQAHAWGEALPRQSASQIVTVYVHQLRRKLRALGLEESLVTVRNFGYAFVPASRTVPPVRPVRRGGGGPSSRKSTSSRTSTSSRPSSPRRRGRK
ncbi:MAG TPA: winged helix-turn-helix domain-containing protein [Gemmatimonadaceae bacterium]